MGVQVINPPVTSGSIVAALGFTPAATAISPIPVGTVSAPGAAFEGATDRGLYLTGANQVGIAAPSGVFIGANGPISTGLISGGAYNSSVDFELRDLNNDGYTEFRLADNAGSSDHFFAFYYTGQLAYIETWKPSGAATIDISPKSKDLTSVEDISLFRNGESAGGGRLRLYIGQGSGTVQTEFRSNGDGYVTGNAGKFGVGFASPLATLHVQGVRGSTSNELARLTKSSAGTALGLSLGYDDASTTAAYVYNRNTNAASLIQLGFGTTYGSSVALALSPQGPATFSTTAGESARFVRTDATLGLSFGYSEAGNTTASIYNRYSNGVIQFGAGSTFGSSVMLTLDPNAGATFGGAAFFSPGASRTPSVNGQVTFQLTNNTTLTFKAQGSDGTVRSGTVTLA